MNEFEILSLKQENELSLDEKKQYYEDLRYYLFNRKLKVTTRGATTIAPKLKKVTNKIVGAVTKLLSGGEYTKTVKGIENIP